MSCVGTFYGHEAAGAPIVKAVLTRLRFPADDVKACTKIVREHLRPGFPGQPISNKTLRKWVAEMGDLWEDALDHRVCDIAAHVIPEGIDPWAWAEEIRQRVRALPPDLAGFNQRALALSGEEIREGFKLDGKAIGKAKKLLVEAVIAGKVPNERAALLKFLAETPLVD